MPYYKTMVTIKYSDIPIFLHDSAFYKSLCDSNIDDDIEFPDQSVVFDDQIYDLSDFTKLLKVSAFWGLNKIPYSVIAFCQEHVFHMWCGVLYYQFAGMDFAQDLLACFDPASWTPSIIHAIEKGRTELVEFSVNKQKHCLDGVATAAFCGRIDYIKLLRQHDHVWNAKACQKAVEGGHLDCLQFLFENGCPWDKTVHLAAAEFNQLLCMKYAMSQGLALDGSVPDIAAAEGHLDILKFAVEQGLSINASTVDAAAFNGRLECLQFLLQLGCEATATACQKASIHGHLECLKLLHVSHIPWDVSALHGAARCGHLDCLMYLHDSSCPWDVSTCEFAAEGGHLDCLQYLHQNNCPWNISTTQAAAQKCCVQTLRYAIENGCPYDKHVVSDVRTSSSDKKTDCLVYLLQELKLKVNKDDIVCD